MRVHLDELEAARVYAHSREFDSLSPEQLRAIAARGRELFKWFKAHQMLHALINISVLAALGVADWWVLRRLPHLILGSDPLPPTGSLLLAAVVTGVLHSWLGYSLSIFSLHEGAAHNLIFPGTGRVGRLAQRLARNLCRLASAEPDHYAEGHMAHHAKFGTEHDPEFLNFVRPRRLWLILLPFGVFINFSDFVVHRPLTYTRGRILSGAVGAVYQGVYAWLSYRSFGAMFTVIVFLILLPHVGFWTDRLRQFTEHNLMPLDNPSGARSFGVGFWGLIVGGGPWGQPCHLAHHLVPSIPWYQQLILHRYIVSLLTDTQRAQFLVRPIVGYPLLVWQTVRQLNAFAGRGAVPQVPAVDRPTESSW